MGLVDILHPLIKKLVEAVFPLSPVAKVQLRNDYIHPPFFQPFPDIGKQLCCNCLSIFAAGLTEKRSRRVWYL